MTLYEEWKLKQRLKELENSLEITNSVLAVTLGIAVGTYLILLFS